MFALCFLHPPVAQSVEREAYTFVVLGSSPSGRTNAKLNPFKQKFEGV